MEFAGFAGAGADRCRLQSPAKGGCVFDPYVGTTQNGAALSAAVAQGPKPTPQYAGDTSRAMRTRICDFYCRCLGTSTPELPGSGQSPTYGLLLDSTPGHGRAPERAVKRGDRPDQHRVRHADNPGRQDRGSRRGPVRLRLPGDRPAGRGPYAVTQDRFRVPPFQGPSDGGALDPGACGAANLPLQRHGADPAPVPGAALLRAALHHRREVSAPAGPDAEKSSRYKRPCNEPGRPTIHMPDHICLRTEYLRDARDAGMGPVTAQSGIKPA